MREAQLRDNVRRWRKTKRGLVSNLYTKMKSRNTVSFSLDFLHEFSMCKKFDRLFSEWVKSNYNKKLKPSIDRINRKFGYTEKNIHWLTWEENRFKETMERRSRKGAVAQILNGKIIKIFRSQREAYLTSGLSQGNISSAINGKRKYAGGFEWKYYENPDLLTAIEKALK